MGDSDPASTCLLTAAPCKARGRVPLRAPSPGRQEAVGWQTVCRGAAQGSSSPARLVGQAWAAGSPEASCRVHAAFLLPSFAQGPASSSPLCGRPAPSPAPLDAMHCPCALVPCLALPATPLCFQCLTAPAPLLAETLAMRLPLFPGPTWNPCEVLTRGLRGRNINSGMGSAPGKPLPAYSCLFLPFCCSSLAGVGTEGDQHHICQT